MDVYRLLARYGEFRDVRIWRLQHTAGKVDLTCRRGIPHKPSELLTGDRRRLIVVVSDCVAPAWHNGNMRQLIATWTEKLPVVVFHVFPERLWSRTALARSVTVELQGRQFGLPNHDLKPFARSVWDRERLQGSLKQSNVRLPVVTLEQDLLSSWARVVAGDRRSRSLGIVWDAQPATRTTPSQSSSLKDRIDSFLLMSSPISRDLAALLASAPVITLPIVRLIKQSMLPHASPVHIAEVFMSGLLKVSGDQTPTFKDAERIAYELVDDEVRDRLRAGSRVVEAFDVFERVSAYVAQGLGKSVNEFWALLRTPAMGESSEETEFLNAFAAVSAKLLRGLGSEFEAIATSLAPPTPTHHDSQEEMNLFLLEDVEYEVAELIDALPIQPYAYESATITAILERFDFETACFASPHPSPRSNKAYQKLIENYLLAKFLVELDLESFIQNIFTSRGSPALPSLRLRTRDYRRKVAAIVNDIFKDGHLFDTLILNLCEQDPQARAVLQEGELFRRQAVAWGYREILTPESAIADAITLDMIAIPGGTFTMGAPESEPESDDRERPQHEVTLQPFYMGRYPITQAQWRIVAGYPLVNKELDPDPSRFKGDNRPVERVSWEDAQEFCRRLSQKTGKPYRLPSEAEWEYACRAGTATPFHFGDMLLPELANYYTEASYNDSPTTESQDETTDVGIFPANEWGLHDMHGNVWDWCADDWHRNYEDAPDDGSAWMESKHEQLGCPLRGGSWLNLPWFCRSAVRDFAPRDNCSGNIGFRVCCLPPRTLPV